MQIRFLFIAILAAVLLIAASTAPTMAADAPAIEWQQLLGGDNDDQGYSMQKTSDGGYILFGFSRSSANGDVTGTQHVGPNPYPYDYWVVKVNGTGAVEWEKLLGGGLDEQGFSVDQATDGGYFLVGPSYSSADGDVTEWGHGLSDSWVVKLDSTGAIQWDRLLGGEGHDSLISVYHTTDGGCILTGGSDSYGSGDPGNTRHGTGDDAWVVKLSGTGEIQWEKRFGGDSNQFGSGFDTGRSVRQTSDGGYILLAGSTSSANGDITGRNHGAWDVWMVKLDRMGTIQWQKLLGGSATEQANSIEQTTDGGYILLGESDSSRSGNVTGTTHGAADFWVVKLDATGTVQWDKLLGGSNYDIGRSGRQTSDGGYILLGFSKSSASGDVTDTIHDDPTNGIYAEDMWIVKLDRTGIIQWQKLIGGDYLETGESVVEAPEGGFVLFGSSWSSTYGDVTTTNHGWSDFWIVKLEGSIQIVAVPEGTNNPTDTNADGKYDDVNGNGRTDFNDVVLYFNQMAWITANEPVPAFDYNSNGRIDFADVVWLFGHL